MKADLDRLMEERGIDAVLILPGETEDPYRTYLSNGVRSSGMVIKVRGVPPVLIVNGMEREEAAKSGLTVYTDDDMGLSALLAQHADARDQAIAEYFRGVFERLGVRGKVALYGVNDIHNTLRTVRMIEQHFAEQIELVLERARFTVFDRAYETKDADELALLRDVGRRTSAVMRAARAWIGSHRAGDGVAVKADGSPLTIGEVKRYVRGQLFEQGLEDPEGMIFAQGHDAGVPHSRGEDADPVRLGEPIVFDLFPREPGGYFHDMTRTWCVGHATPEVQAIYDTVMAAYRASIAMCKPGLPTSDVQRMVCELFEDTGHKTVLNAPGTTEGYVHSLAHGVGLNVHEAPYFPTFGQSYVMAPGNVFTIEPGLYYPERGYGVRIEDTVTLTDEGALDVLTDCPYDLIIPLQG